MAIFPLNNVHFQHALSLRQLGGGYLLNSSTNTIGIANSWTIAFWVKPMDMVSGNVLFTLKSANNADRIIINTTATAGQIQFQNNASGAGAIKNYLYNNAYFHGNWYHYAYTWDGTTLLFYNNGVATTADTKTSDNAGTMTTTARSVGFGVDVLGSNNGDCSLHSAAIWSTVLTAAEAALLYNDGNGTAFDCRTIQPTSLQHWWLVGRGDTTPGTDYGLVGTAIDISTNGALTQIGQPNTAIVRDAPVHNFSPVSAFPGHKYSLDFNGSSSQITSTATFPIGVANAWSCSMWVKPKRASFTVQEIFVTIGTANSAASSIGFELRGELLNDPFNIIMRDSASSGLKDYRYNNFFTTQLWHHIVATWDGTTLTAYKNGAAVTADTKTVDAGGSQADAANRGFGIGANTTGANFFTGGVHSLALYSTVLNASQVTSLYNGGNGWSFDCSTIPGLQHWFLCGDPYIGNAVAYDRMDTAVLKSIDPTSATMVSINPTSSLADFPSA